MNATRARWAADRVICAVLVAAAAQAAGATTETQVLIVEVGVMRRLRGAVTPAATSPPTWRAIWCEARTCLSCGRRVSALVFAPLDAPCRACVDDERKARAELQRRREEAWNDR